jgi:molecular chaperone HscB
LPSTSDAAPVPPVKCSGCNRPMDSPLFCEGCGRLYPAEGYNYFDLFGLPPQYDLDTAALRRKYLETSRAIHPDHHGQRPEAALMSLRASARLNEAYRVLADPLLRAEYLLELFGGSSAAQDRSVGPDVLAQTLALREQLEEARQMGLETQLADLRRQIETLCEQTESAVRELARHLPGDENLRRELRQQLNALRYYQKLRESV